MSIEFLNNNQYLTKCNYRLEKVRQFLVKDFCLYHIEELTFEEKSPRKEALENVLSSLRLENVNFVYLIVGDRVGVHFYFGVAKNLNKDIELEIDIDDIGEDILKSSIQGNFRGSKVTKLSANDRNIIRNNFDNMNYFGVVEGVPGINENNENFQGVDRLVDVMLGDEFMFCVVSSPLNKEEILSIEKNLYYAYSKLYPKSKHTIQEGSNEAISKNTNNTKSETKTTGDSKTTGTSNSKTENNATSTSIGKSTTKSTNTSTSKSKNYGETNTQGSSDTKGTTFNGSKSIARGKTKSFSCSNSESNTSSGSNSSSQKGGSEGSSETKTDTTGTTNNTSSTKNESKSVNKGNSDSETTGTSTSESENNNSTINKGTSETFSDNNSLTKSISNSISTSESFGESTNSGTSESLSKEFVDREAQEWLKYLDEVIIPRLDYGKGKGMFATSSFIAAKNKASLIKLGNTIKSLYSGVEGNKVPLQLSYINDDKSLNFYKNFQIPVGIKDKNDNNYHRSVISQVTNDNKIIFGNWISTNELSLIAGLPQKEIVGLKLKEEVEFGLNFTNNIKNENKINLGKIIQSGRVIDIDVCLDKENLNKHTFVTGVTGSGKTTTCQKILVDSNLPFMVVEPAKTEYRILTSNYDDILIFTLGKDNLAPFRLNPFEFYEHENISSRVDMIKACIEASFDMEAAIPQIIESAIYECYKDYGWNISNNKNYKFKNPFDKGVYAFPTLSDLIAKTEQVVIKQGFDDRLKNDYIGSIKARLQGLTLGSKGFMLNTKRSVDFKELVNKRVILELEEIKNGNEKSLVMGFILINLNEAIKANFNKNPKFKHITLVEEAHRLLSKYEYGDSPNKKQGVEVFSDMLAEVRKYGESLIIADQIPNKLTPEVLKNTNTKIVHKIFAKDDKEAIGNTMSLKDEQKEFMSSLDVGRAIVFSQGWDKAIQVKINKVTNTTCEEIISEDLIIRNCMKYYQNTYKSGVIEGIQYLENEPDIEFLKQYFEFLQEGVFEFEFRRLLNKMSIENIDLLGYIKNFDKLNNKEFIYYFIINKIFSNKNLDDKQKSLLKEISYKLLNGDFLKNNKISIGRDYKIEINEILKGVIY